MTMMRFQKRRSLLKRRERRKEKTLLPRAPAARSDGVYSRWADHTITGTR